MLNQIFRNFIVPSFLVFITAFGFSQATDELYTIIEYPALPETIISVDDQMDETSGLIKIGDNLWTMNDSGGKPELYLVDPKTGKAVQTIKLTNAENIDWEALAQDDNFIYVGDFGNNFGTRKDLTIYKISKRDISESKVIKVEAEVIEIAYTDQHSFEFRNRNHNFDCESLISFGDDLILFSKNWVNGKTRMYKVSKMAGSYNLSPVDDFDVDGLVTGADLCLETNQLALIGYKDRVPFIFLFNNFNGNKLGTDKVYRFNLNKLKNSQTESISYIDKDIVVFSTEQTKAFDQQIFKLNLSKILEAANL